MRQQVRCVAFNQRRPRNPPGRESFLSIGLPLFSPRREPEMATCGARSKTPRVESSLNASKHADVCTNRGKTVCSSRNCFDENRKRGCVRSSWSRTGPSACFVSVEHYDWFTQRETYLMVTMQTDAATKANHRTRKTQKTHASSRPETRSIQQI